MPYLKRFFRYNMMGWDGEECESIDPTAHHRRWPHGLSRSRTGGETPACGTRSRPHSFIACIPIWPPVHGQRRWPSVSSDCIGHSFSHNGRPDRRRHCNGNFHPDIHRPKTCGDYVLHLGGLPWSTHPSERMLITAQGNPTPISASPELPVTQVGPHRIVHWHHTQWPMTSQQTRREFRTAVLQLDLLSGRTLNVPLKPIVR